ncbi:ERG2/sigma1 receptor-like protein [Gilbertella persicaria]|uniref:C-8 sterol isomerase n=1 Tax=Rhizopus stolonifer TaxID=4846 RepID=A0A367KVI0_RHIST|nr:ERG2/sigma1 receptor-like protein [Gilbertella persicaria]KAI8066305.1 ERG2/sigma1 receptor-like protein [Gilbertella persicaria]RCI05892.1 C-8 sterol isomerase [Rhizopus stolonifer]
MTAKVQSEQKTGCWTKCLFVLSLLLAICMGLDQVIHHCYIFDQHKLQEVAQRNIAKYGQNDTRAMIQNIALDLEKEYPGHVSLKEDWVFNNAGGAMGAMWILHGSLSEYVIIFGTPIGTEGHTGRYFADDYFIILEGEQWAYYPGELQRTVFKPGEMHHLPRGLAQHYKIDQHAWALEYARGWIPAMLPFGFFDSLFSTIDVVTMYHTFRVYGTAIIKELLQGKI